MEVKPHLHTGIWTSLAVSCRIIVQHYTLELLENGNPIHVTFREDLFATMAQVPSRFTLIAVADITKPAALTKSDLFLRKWEDGFVCVVVRFMLSYTKLSLQLTANFKRSHNNIRTFIVHVTDKSAFCLLKRKSRRKLCHLFQNMWWKWGWRKARLLVWRTLRCRMRCCSR